MALILSKPNHKGRRDVMIILGPDNIERMKEQDPFEVKWFEFPWREEPGVVAVTYADDELMAQVTELAKAGKTIEAAELATKGWKFRPEMGDHDRGFEPIGPEVGEG